MSAIHVGHFSYRYTYPAREEPGWKGLVDRWYQLDAQGYGLAQAFWQWKPRLGELPSMLILASPGASNETDRAFAASGASSPAKFTHTLPNVRSSPLCQVMGWSGPMLCLQLDPVTQIAALAHGAEWTGTEFPRVWVIGCAREDAGYVVRGWTLSAEPTEGSRQLLRPAKQSQSTNTDRDLAKFSDGEQGLNEFALVNGWVMK